MSDVPQSGSDQAPEPQSGDRSSSVEHAGARFLASLNHDVRTPLSGIVGMTDLLEETELNEEQQEYVSTTRLCADQLLELLNSALEYASLASGAVKIQPAELHLPQLLQAVIEEFAPKAEAKGLKIRGSFPNLPGTVICDELRLRQAVKPLVANAVKFTHDGEVEISAAIQGDPAAASALLAITVRDTGIGIPKDKLEAIFESFRQLESGLSRSYAGMGLGLAVGRKLAEMMGGGISVESEPGQGSVFRLDVPVSLPAPPEADPIEDAAGVASGEDNRPFVLLVDDNDVARRVVKHILNRANYRIDCAEDGESGIAAAREHCYDLILMDLQMPGVDGMEATERIRRMNGYRTTPILALTANYSEEFVRECNEVGFDGFLSKPIQRDKLVEELDRRLR